jgi:hypothetical protein
MPFFLFLNDMRSSHVEELTRVCRADSVEELQALIDRERVELYTDTGSHAIVNYTDSVARNAGRAVLEPIPAYRWGKGFRKGGPLEWFNPPHEYKLTPQFVVTVPSEQEYLDKVRIDYQQTIFNVIHVSTLT